jgi:ferredoxin-nitrate reductase
VLFSFPFHYGYWDEDDDRPRAANELTITEWDAVSKQPHFKYAAVKISKANEGILHKIGEAFETIKEKLKPEEA